MRILVLALLIGLISLAAFASPALILPVAPDTHSFITVTIGGAWPDACVPTAVDASLSGNIITVAVHQGVTPSSGCLTLMTQWRLTANVGILPAGTYTLHAFIQSNVGRTDLGSTQLIVRAVDPFRAFPPGAPASGGTQVRLVSPDVWPTNQVVFGDGAPVTATQSGKVLYVTAPAHAAGTVDVKVGTQTAASAFTFYDPTDRPDPSVFEPVLFPIAFTGEGAFGSSWVTDNIISAPAAEFATTLESGAIASLVRLDGNDPAGLRVHVGRGTTSAAAMSSRIRYVTRQAQSAGTEIPVVRESDWRVGTLRLTNIPADPHSRITLRVWEDHDRPVSVSVETSVRNRAQFASTEVGLAPQANGLLYTQLDLTDLVARIPGTDPRDLKIEALAFDPDIRLWALVTVTNNDTQQVTAIWPR